MSSIACETWFEIETCYKCGIQFGVPSYRARVLKEKGETFYCPNGHDQYYTESQVQRLTKELARKDQQLAAAKEETERQRKMRQAEERRVASLKGVVTRTKRRVCNGVCPCCNRSFPNDKMPKHIATVHPDYVTSDA